MTIYHEKYKENCLKKQITVFDALTSHLIQCADRKIAELKAELKRLKKDDGL